MIKISTSDRILVANTKEGTGDFVCCLQNDS